MRKQFLLMLILCLAASVTWAERIDVATARKVAESVATGGGSSLRSSADLSLVYAAAPGQSGTALRSGRVEGSADYFVFNFPGDGGFAIVAGDDRVRPVLGYSHEGSFDPDNLPENLRGMLAYYQDQIAWANDKGIDATPEISAEWSRLMSGTALRAAGEPVLLQTANWNQEEPYNNQTPVINGQKTYTGCGATATAIVMRYHGHPVDAVTNGLTSYTVRGTNYPVNYAPYVWEQMPLNYNPGSYTTEQANQVATLMWHIGANVKMEYDVIGSWGSASRATDIAEALRSVFGYSEATRCVWKSDYRWEDWKKMIRAEIGENRPMIYSGTGGSGGGHLFVLDGYDQEEAFHFNWGWGGSSNGYYLLTSLTPNDYDFSQEMGMIVGITPKEAGEKMFYEMAYLSLSSSVASLQGQTSFSVSATIKNTSSTTFNGYANIGLVAENGTITPISANFNITELGVGYYYESQSFQCTLSSPMTASDKILPIYSLDGSKWEIMRGAADAPLYLGINGVVEEGDDPNDPTDKPVVVSSLWNGFDRSILPASGLDNSRYNSENVKSIAFDVKNAKENLVVRYILKDYAAWKGHLNIYTGTDLNAPNTGTLITPDANGAFEQTFDLSDIADGRMDFDLKVLSDQAGELSYEIQVYEESDKTNDLLAGVGGDLVMRFADKVQTQIEPNPIYGVTNTKIPFTYTVKGVDARLSGKEMTLLVGLSVVDDQTKLYYVRDGKEEEIPLTQSTYDPVYFSSDRIAVGALAEGASFTFKIESVNETKEVEAGRLPSVDITPALADGTQLPYEYCYAQLKIGKAPVVTHKVSYNLTGLSVENAPSVVENGKSLSFSLACQPGYKLPDQIKVTMGSTALEQGQQFHYDKASGYVSVNSVTGDVVITATATPIPVVTYTISFGQLENLESDLPSGSVSIEEGLGFTVKLTAKAGFLLPKTVNVKNGDTELAAGTDYIYTSAADRKNGEIKIKAVNSDLTIYAIAEAEPKHFTITQVLTNLTSDKANTVTVLENAKHELTLKAAANYRLPDAIAILNGETPLTTGTDYAYDKASGKVTIHKVTADLTIKASGIDDRHFMVAFDLEGVKADPSSIDQQFLVGEKASFNVKFAAAEGYDYEGTISVKMGDKTLAAGTDYTYDKETGVFALTNGITATLTISAKAVKKQYKITTTYTCLTPMEVPNTVAHGDPMSFKFVPDEGYNLPKEIEVKMAGTVLTAGEGYTYNQADGTVTIAKVTGDVEVTAIAVVKTYAVKQSLTNLTSDFVIGTMVAHGEPLDIQLTAPAGYELPKTVTVKMNGKPDPNFMYENGKITIAKVLGPIEITAAAVKLHAVEDKVENVTVEGTDNVAQGETFAGTIRPAGGYSLPYAISVMMNGRMLKAGEYSYDNVTGEVKIPNVSGPIQIVAKGVQDGYYEVILTLTNLTSDPASFEPRAEDTKVELTLKPVSGYELPSSITVKMGEATLVAGTDYTYDKATGKFSLEKIADRLLITAKGHLIYVPEPEPEPTPTYTVTLPVVEGAVIAATGSTTVNEGSNLSFTVEVKEGYNADNMVVKANGTTLTADANGRYTIANIRGNVVVTVSGIVKGDNPTGIDSVTDAELKVWAANGQLHIRTPKAEMAYIVTFDGRAYKTLSLPAGEYAEQMPRGAYIVHIGGQSYKLRF